MLRQREATRPAAATVALPRVKQLSLAGRIAMTLVSMAFIFLGVYELEASIPMACFMFAFGALGVVGALAD